MAGRQPTRVGLSALSTGTVMREPHRINVVIAEEKMTNSQHVVLVGLGSYNDGTAELDWAAAEAQARHAQLRVVRTYQLAEGIQPWSSSVDDEWIAALRRDAEHRLKAALSYLGERWPAVAVTGSVVDGVPWQVLIDGSADAAVTVVGSRQLGPIGAGTLGSVSTVVAAASHGPVVVVGRPGSAATEPGSVIVGVDGSELGDEVLAFAFDYASRHRRSLNAVYCWRPDLLATSQWRGARPAPERAGRWLAEALAGWQEKYSEVQLHRGVVRDHPVAGLVAASAGQDLLVVGAHAKHARIMALLGSVSQGVLHHATCPVAVVHPRTSR
jgi:nucleotide-binding universal stress UspA family protein